MPSLGYSLVDILSSSPYNFVMCLIVKFTGDFLIIELLFNGFDIICCLSLLTILATLESTFQNLFQTCFGSLASCNKIGLLFPAALLPGSCSEIGNLNHKPARTDLKNIIF